jgi:imidazolonepropionase
MNEPFDLLVGPIGCLAPCTGPAPRLGESLKELPLLKDSAVGIRSGEVAFVGPWSDVADHPAAQRLDATGKTVLPGFVDAHTHVPFLGDRAHELVMRLQGKSYMEIGKGGGGILSTMRAVRAASEDELFSAARGLARRFLQNGVTTFEAKSGYGLEKEAELKQLRVLKRLAKEGPQTVVSTFLGAHFVPPEYKGHEDGYVDLLCDGVMPAVAEAKLARFCDVFCEEGAFSIEQSKRILLRGKELGIAPRIHADEIVDTGGAVLAAEVGGVSADHLLAASPEGMAAMAKAGVCATLLPGTAFYLRKPYARARAFVDAGCAVAVASDCNPGSCYTANLLQVATLAIFGMGLMPEEALWAVTLNAAYALRAHGRVGSIESGKRADLCLWDVPSPLHLFYPFGENPLHTVICGGKVVSR